MANSFRAALSLFCFLVVSLFLSSSAQEACSNYSFSSNRVFASCKSLPFLNAHLHWSYNSSLGTVDIAYRATQSSTGWVAWAINPTGQGMIGSQALVAYQNTNGVMEAYPSSVDSYATSLQQSNLSFPVSGITAEYVGGQFIIYATLTLPNNATTVNQVWQEGPLSNGSPAIHATSGANVQSFGTLNFQSSGSDSGGTK